MVFSFPLFACPISISYISPITFDWYWDGSEKTATGDIQVIRDTNTDCKKFHVAMTQGGASDYNRTLFNSSFTLNYNLFKRSNHNRIIYDYPTVTQRSQVIIGNFKKKYFLSVPFYAKLEAASGPVKPGTYQDMVTFKVYQNPVGGSAVFEDSHEVPISVIVPELISISLIDSGAPFDSNDTYQQLDFGILQTGQQQQFDLRIQANTGYSIRFSSLNNGAMANLAGNGNINYQVTVDGANKDLSASSSVGVEVVSGASTGWDNVPHQIAVTIGDVSGKPAGSYSDAITVEAVSLY